MGERHYEFRKRLDVVHEPNRRDPQRLPDEAETVIDTSWVIVIDERADERIVHSAKDLQDYLFVSMRVSVRIQASPDLQQDSLGRHVVVLGERADLPQLGEAVHKPGSYRLLVEADRIIVCGYDPRGVSQGGFFVEDVMNLNEAPLLKRQDIRREPQFSPRMVHSGWGLDLYPDTHLNALAHAGFDAILLFVKDVDTTAHSHLDFNDVIDRAALHGLDVYAYSYLISRKHPDEADAEAYYDNTYGRLFRACPKLKGVILVGESCEFPSKDPNTTGMLRRDWPKDQLRTKPNPGWWPCIDYPQWLALLQKVIRQANPAADIVFWTYNWGYAPEEERLRLIRSLPDDITLLVTFEMFEQLRRGAVTHVCMDYTISFEGPGRYFTSEAEAAAERGLKLYTMSNTAGLTWDVGVIPYEPVPFQWSRRHEALLQAKQKWRLSGLMESHHYGVWPSFLTDIAKWKFWSPAPQEEELFAAIACRDFGKEAVPRVLEAWTLWSEAIRHYIPSNEDQYGPFRIGPSYPLVFQSFPHALELPQSPSAFFGNEIIWTDYKPFEGFGQSPGIVRVDSALEALKDMEAKWHEGNERLQAAVALTPERKRAKAMLQLGMNRFIVHTIRTAIHVKLWWKLKQRLFNEPDPQLAGKVLDEMEQLVQSEIINAEAAIPYVEQDSRLGWEPTMEYMTDAAHIRWKIRQAEHLLNAHLPNYRRSLGQS